MEQRLVPLKHCKRLFEPHAPVSVQRMRVGYGDRSVRAPDRNVAVGSRVAANVQRSKTQAAKNGPAISGRRLNLADLLAWQQAAAGQRKSASPNKPFYLGLH